MSLLARNVSHNFLVFSYNLFNVRGKEGGYLAAIFVVPSLDLEALTKT